MNLRKSITSEVTGAKYDVYLDPSVPPRDYRITIRDERGVIVAQDKYPAIEYGSQFVKLAYATIRKYEHMLSDNKRGIEEWEQWDGQVRFAEPIFE